MAYTIDNPVATAEAPPIPSPAVEPRTSHLSILSGIQWITYILVMAIFVMTYVIQAFQIPSESMENTLLIGDYLLVDKVQYGPRGVWGEILPYEPVSRGDVIVFKWPVHPGQHFVKRVMGIPGDRIRLVNGRVLVNGSLAKEDYALYKRSPHDSFRDEFPSRPVPSPLITAKWWAEIPLLLRNGDLLVPQDSYFVLGDNRNESLDSRYWGLVPRENIVGKPLFIYFSLTPSSSAALSETPNVKNDKMSRFADVLTHLPAMARWGRTFMLVK